MARLWTEHDFWDSCASVYDLTYNDAKEAGSYLIARLGAAGVAGISSSDFLLS